MADELDGIAIFVAVAEAKGFRAAGERLGMSHSAVSQTLRRLEERLGAPLVRRTTRSVHLTHAGSSSTHQPGRRLTRCERLSLQWESSVMSHAVCCAYTRRAPR